MQGVVAVESWAQSKATLVRDNCIESNAFNIVAPPNGSDMLEYPLVAGRWLRPDDQNALVMTPGMLGQEPDLKVGD